MNPEQARAIAYLQRRGTEANTKRLLSDIRSIFSEVESFLSKVPAHARAYRPRPGAWSIHEVVDHLIESHAPAVTELTHLLRGIRPENGPIPAHLQSAAPFSIPWDSLVEKLETVHADFLRALDNADGAPVDVRAPVLLVVKTLAENGAPRSLEWIEELDWKAYVEAFRLHTVQHLEQMKRALAASAE